MIKVDLDVREIEKRLNEVVSPKRIEIALKEAVIYAKSQVAIYPPKPPNSKYNRKGARGGLASGWSTAQPQYKSLNAFVANSIPYATYVQGDRQAWWHKRTGWLNVSDVLEKRANKIVKIMKQSLERE